MKLTEENIRVIYIRTANFGLFYDEVRHELTDHIASALEDQLTDESDFRPALNSYLNSRKMVRLLAAAKKHEEILDGQNIRSILRQFATLKGISFMAISLIVLLLAKSDIWLYRFFEGVFLVLLLVMTFGLKNISRKERFLGRLVEVSRLYYVLPCLLATQLYRFDISPDTAMNLKTMAMSIIFTGCWLTYRQSRKLNNRCYA